MAGAPRPRRAVKSSASKSCKSKTSKVKRAPKRYERKMVHKSQHRHMSSSNAPPKALHKSPHRTMSSTKKFRTQNYDVQVSVELVSPTFTAKPRPVQRTPTTPQPRNTPTGIDLTSLSLQRTIPFDINASPFRLAKAGYSTHDNSYSQHHKQSHGSHMGGGFKPRRYPQNNQQQEQQFPEEQQDEEIAATTLIAVAAATSTTNSRPATATDNTKNISLPYDELETYEAMEALKQKNLRDELAQSVADRAWIRQPHSRANPEDIAKEYDNRSRKFITSGYHSTSMTYQTRRRNQVWKLRIRLLKRASKYQYGDDPYAETRRQLAAQRDYYQHNHHHQPQHTLNVDDMNEEQHLAKNNRYAALMDNVNIQTTPNTSPIMKAMVAGVAAHNTTPRLQPNVPSPNTTPNQKDSRAVARMQMPHLQLNHNTM